MHPRHDQPQRWAVVLAGGEGERMRPFITRWLGRHRPKQYCAFAGEKTMIEHTMERVLGLTAATRLITVIGRGHWQYLDEPRRLMVPGRIVEQPAMRETAPGIYLPLSYVMAGDTEGLVAVLPSDHYIRPRRRFSMYVDRAFSLAERLEDKIVLLAAPANRPETDYGWLEPGGPVTSAAPSARRILRFHEKPGPDAAAEFLRRGFLWNTMIMVAKAQTLWSLGKRLYPAMMWRFDALAVAARGGSEASLLREIYRDMDAVNFSRDILQRAPQCAVALPMSGVDWCDWGRPERVLETLERAGKYLESAPDGAAAEAEGKRWERTCRVDLAGCAA